MPKGMRDLTEADKKAVTVWQQILQDHTLSKDEHQKAKDALDVIFERGPLGAVAELTRRVEALEQALDPGRPLPTEDTRSQVSQPPFVLSGKRGQWYVVEVETDKVVAGVYAKKSEAEEELKRRNTGEVVQLDLFDGVE